MTDAARIQRLTEIARRVWPGPDGEVYAAHASVATGRGDLLLLVDHTHPRALDALEAALLVLLGEVEFRRRDPIREVTAVGPTGIEYADGGELRIEAEEPPAWVEQLAREWEHQAREPGTLQGTQRPTMESCARELRERVKGKP